MIYNLHQVTRFVDFGRGMPNRFRQIGNQSEELMARIQDNYLACVLYLYPSEAAALAGVDVGGSGFIVGRKSKNFPDKVYLFAVTNRHVVIDGGCKTIRLHRKDGTPDIIPASNWVYDTEHDVAITGINCDPHRFAFVEDNTFVTADRIKELDIGVGDDVFMVGRFIAKDGGPLNAPSARFGNLAMMPQAVSLQGGGAEESFLVDIRSIGGYSGSPVFITIPPFSVRPNLPGMPMTAGGPFLLGVDWGNVSIGESVMVPQNQYGKTEFVPQSDGHCVLHNTGFACVVPAWHIINLIDSDPMKKELEYREDQLLKMRPMSGPIGVRDVATPKFTTTDFTDALKKVSQRLPQPLVPPAEPAGSSPPES